MDMQRIADYRDRVVSNCGKVIVGKEEQILLVLVCFLCGGHVLLEDIPGTGKTMLLRAFAKTMGGSFRRIQFTPDLLPSDLTGLNIYSQKTGEFSFVRGPLFANVVLADELNRATPRTQASLLEAMEEKQITVDGETHVLERPFFVMATQNPLESSGTFPLPDAQMDRFFMRLSLGYMTRAQEMAVIARPASAEILSELPQTVRTGETEEVQRSIREVTVSEPVLSYLMDLIEATRNESNFISGVSTRGAIALCRAAQAYAALSGRSFVIPEDVRHLAVPVLCHRMGAGSGMGRQAAEKLMGQILAKIPVPLETV